MISSFHSVPKMSWAHFSLQPHGFHSAVSGAFSSCIQMLGICDAPVSELLWRSINRQGWASVSVTCCLCLALCLWTRALKMERQTFCSLRQLTSFSPAQVLCAWRRCGCVCRRVLRWEGKQRHLQLTEFSECSAEGRRREEQQRMKCKPILTRQRAEAHC